MKVDQTGSSFTRYPAALSLFFDTRHLIWVNAGSAEQATSQE
jgi:hypothetical protein